MTCACGQLRDVERILAGDRSVAERDGCDLFIGRSGLEGRNLPLLQQDPGTGVRTSETSVPNVPSVESFFLRPISLCWSDSKGALSAWIVTSMIWLKSKPLVNQRS